MGTGEGSGDHRDQMRPLYSRIHQLLPAVILANCFYFLHWISRIFRLQEDRDLSVSTLFLPLSWCPEQWHVAGTRKDHVTEEETKSWKVAWTVKGQVSEGQSQDQKQASWPWSPRTCPQGSGWQGAPKLPSSFSVSSHFLSQISPTLPYR